MTLGQGHMKCCSVPSTSCDLHVCSYKVEVAMSTSLGGDTFISNVTDGHTEAWTDGGLWYKINTGIPFFLKKKAGIKSEYDQEIPQSQNP